MNNELINRTSRAIASCKDDAPILKAVLIDCKTEMLATDLKLLSAEAKIKQLESELQKAREYSFSDGEPPTWFEEWFIALLDNKQRVVLKRLPEEYSYDYKTADETYYKAFRISKWMQFPDSGYLPINDNKAREYVPLTLSEWKLVWKQPNPNNLTLSELAEKTIIQRANLVVKESNNEQK